MISFDRALHVLLLILVNDWLIQSRGHDVTCSARLYPGEADVDISFPVIFGLRRSKLGGCGGVQPAALQQAVAFNWAVSLLNGANAPNGTSFIPGVRLGVDIYDDCGQPYLTAIRAGELAAVIQGVKSCPADGSKFVPHIPIAGIIGTELSYTTPILATTVLSTHVPVIGISATLTELSNKQLYSNFLRTVPSDIKQAQAMVQLAKHYNWTYIVGVHSLDNYGRQGMQEVRRLARQERICVSAVESFDFGEPSEEQMENFVRNILFQRVEDSQDSIGVIYFGHGSTLGSILAYMHKNKGKWHNAQFYLSRINWVASEAVPPSAELATAMNSFFGTKIILITPPKTRVESFEEHYYNFLKNPPVWAVGPWMEAIKEVMAEEFGCPDYNFTSASLQPCLPLQARFSTYLVAALDAVYLLAENVREMHLKECGGQPGVCPALEARLDTGLLRHGEMVNLNYSALGSDYVPKGFIDAERVLVNMSGDFQPVDEVMYSIAANVGADGFTEIGQYKGGKVTLDPAYTNLVVPSQCKKTCAECADVDVMTTTFSPGDVILLGFYSLHWNQEGFACGRFREDSPSYMAMIAFLNAVEWLKKNTGINFGYLIIDDCYSPLVANRMLVEIMSGDLKIYDGNGTMFDPNKVVIAIGAQSSPVTMATVLMLQRLKIPMISFSASNHNLDNRIMYPYFSRTLSGDRIQAKVFMEILLKLKVTYVGVMAIPNSYGLELYRMFREMAEAEGICVDDAIEVTQDTPLAVIEEGLVSYRSRNIRVIVIIAMDQIVSNILDAVEVDDIFVFLGSEAWGTNQNVIDGDRGERARGSLVLSVQNENIDYGFKDYISKLHPFQEAADAWLREFWQDKFQCNLDGQFDNTYSKTCKEVSTGTYFTPEQIELEARLPMAVHSLYATLSAGLAISELDKAGVELFHSPKELTEAVRKVELTTSTGQPFRLFLDSGSGKGGFGLFNVQLVGGKYEYVRVGDANGEGKVTLDLTKLKFYDITGNLVTEVVSSCQFRAECAQVCLGEPTTQAPPKNTSVAGVVTAAAIADCESTSARDIALAVICTLVVVAVVLVILVCCFCCRGMLMWNKNHTYSDGSMAQAHYSMTTPFGRTPRSRQTSSSGEVGPPLPPSRQGTRSTSPGIDNLAFTDISLGDDLQADAMSVRSRSYSIPLDQGVLAVSPEDMVRPVNPSTLPAPRAHRPQVVPITQKDNSNTTSSSSASQHSYNRYTPSPPNLQQQPSTRPSFFLPHEQEIPPNAQPQAMAAVPSDEETQVKFPHSDPTQPTYVPVYDSPPSPMRATDMSNQITFTNVPNGGVYNLQDMASNGSLSGSQYWLVKTADGQLVPYQNVHQVIPQPALPSPNQQLPHTDPGTSQRQENAAFLGNPMLPAMPLSNHYPVDQTVPSSRDMSPGYQRSQSISPRDETAPMASPMTSAPPFHQPGQTQGAFDEEQLGAASDPRAMTNGPTPHVRQSKYQDDYITPLDLQTDTVVHGSTPQTGPLSDQSLPRVNSGATPDGHLPSNAAPPEGEISSAPSIDHTPSAELSVDKPSILNGLPSKVAPPPQRPQNLTIAQNPGGHNTTGPDTAKAQSVSPVTKVSTPPGASGVALRMAPGQTNSLPRKAINIAAHRISDIPEVDQETDSLV